jgi:intracellular septation protein A
MIQFLTNLAAITSNSLPKATVTTSMPTVLRTVFAFAGVLSVLFVVIGGFRYTISSGDPGQIKQAKETILYAIIGLVLTISAFTIVSFVLGQL